MTQIMNSHWDSVLDADSPVVAHVAADLVDVIVDSSDHVPRPETIAELGLPNAGLILFGTPVADEAVNPTAPTARVTGLMWSIETNLDDFDPMLAITPVVTAAEIGALVTETDAEADLIATLGQLQPMLPVARTDDLLDRVEHAEIDWGHPSHRWLRVLTAFAAWVNSIADVEDCEPSRSVRRAAMRANPTGPSTVRVVKLRRADEIEDRSWDPDNPPPAEKGRVYTHRWIVSAHPRRQPYGPGRSQHRIVMIAPYIKGPADKPLRPKPNVWKVDR